MLGSVQVAGQATNVGVITSVAGGVASQATAAASLVVSNAASLETSIVGEIFARNYTVGTKYACAASSCDKIPSLEVVLCFGLSITVLSVITFTLAFFLPFMKLVSLGCSMLATLFFIVFAACVVSIAEVASLVGSSTFFRVEKGEIFKESLWALGGAILMASSAFGMLLVSPRRVGPGAEADAQSMSLWQRSGLAEVVNAQPISEKGDRRLTGSTIAPSFSEESGRLTRSTTTPSLSEKEGGRLTGSTIAPSLSDKEGGYSAPA